ncbi:hypothetical protein GF377_03695 [candidate division GN15 bacterium]|nr:hypothetical protein [candidate division GN15 bacterium]
MNFGSIFKIFKKGAKATGKGKKSGQAGGGTSWPSGIRVGMFGHANSGKTVYLSVLNEECKIARDLQISVTDHATANEFLRHYRSIWGLSTAVDAGTAVDLSGERKFPDPTQKEHLMQFNATLDRGTKTAVVALDYPGKAIGISGGAHELRDNVMDFMQQAHGLLFYYDPKLLKAELESQAHVASFVNLIEQIAPVNARLPIPIALVVTKADILPGFSGDEQTVLVPAEEESLLAEDFDVFLERILSSNRIASDSAWAASVREVLYRTQAFLKVVIGRTLDFQIFFTSATGQTPEKIGTDIGRSIYAPPKRLAPVGVKRPFHWILNSILRNRRIGVARKVAKWAGMLTVAWVVLYSIPHLWHFSLALDTAQDTEANIMEAYGGNVYNTSDDERAKIGSAYRKYEDSWAVKWFFPSFKAPAGRIRNMYRRFDMSEATRRLEETLDRFRAIVGDTTLWPKVNPADSTLILATQHDQLLTALNEFNTGDESSVLYTRSGRALTYWSLFTDALIQRDDSAKWNVLKQQITQDQTLYGNEISPAEKELGQVLMQHEVEAVKKVVAKETAFEFSDQIVKNVNTNNDPEYRIEQAVRELRQVASKLDRSDAKHHNMIDQYIKRARAWTRSREYTAKFVTLPANARAYVEVTNDGADPEWSTLNMIFEGDEFSFKWKPGQDIHIAIDTVGHDYQWGKNSSDRVVLTDKYALFEMEGNLSFPNVGLQATVTFNPPLRERLPELK